MTRLARRTNRSRISKPKTRIALEQLERRDVPALSPAQITHAYGIDLVKPSDGTLRGTGQTIAIVDAFDDPTILADLQHFDAQFGLPDPKFMKATPQGQPTADTGWALEMALDVEWAHAIAPGANILLVEAKDNSTTNLYAADQYAANLASVVSNSWGGSEYSSETADDGNFVHPGVTFIFSSGDSGAPPEYPSASPNVLAVGGTTLNVDSSGNWISETGWGNGYWSPYFGGSGGGISRYEPKPAFQGSVTKSSTKRTTPDVAFDANPNTGVYVYDTSNGGWFQVGGTSLGAPAWAGLIATVNQGRVIQTQPVYSGGALLNQIYQAPATDFHDITRGNNGYAAGTGYDLVTGRGSPKANVLIPDLINPPSSGGGPPAVTQPTPVSPPTGGPTKPIPRGNRIEVTSTAENNAAIANVGLLNRTVTPTAIPKPTPIVIANAPGVSATNPTGSISVSSQAFGSGGSDRLANELDGAEPLSVMPATNDEDARPASMPAVPREESSTIVPMSREAVDSYFVAPFPAVELNEGSVPAPMPTTAETMPVAEMDTGSIAFVAFLGGLWSVRVAREEEKRPAMQR